MKYPRLLLVLFAVILTFTICHDVVMADDPTPEPTPKWADRDGYDPTPCGVGFILTPLLALIEQK